jgi:hypothetical protein
MTQTQHLHSVCDNCQAEAVTFADKQPDGWITLNGDGISRPVCLCAACADEFLGPLGVSRLDGSHEPTPRER